MVEIFPSHVLLLITNATKILIRIYAETTNSLTKKILIYENGQKIIVYYKLNWYINSNQLLPTILFINIIKIYPNYCYHPYYCSIVFRVTKIKGSLYKKQNTTKGN